MTESNEDKLLPSGYNWGMIAGFTVAVASVFLTLAFLSMGIYNTAMNYMEQQRIANYSSPILKEADKKATEAFDRKYGPYERLSVEDSISAFVNRPADQQAAPVTDADLEAAKAAQAEAKAAKEAEATNAE